MKRILTLTAFFVAPLAALHGEDLAKPGARPNILWIIMDDAGVELPCYGEKKRETP